MINLRADALAAGLLLAAVGLPTAVSAQQSDGLQIYLTPQIAEAPSVGDRVTLELLINSTDNPLIATGILLHYDPAVLALVEGSFEYTLTDYTGFVCGHPQSQCIVWDPPGIDLINGEIETAVGDYFTIGSGMFGDTPVPAPAMQLTFEVITEYETTRVELEEGGIGGAALCFIDTSCDGLAFVGTQFNGAVADPDGDGIAASLDNCTELANAEQQDTDGDGYGNRCDPDLNNDGIVDFDDTAIFREVMFTQGVLDADYDGDLYVNFNDLAIMKSFMFGPPGPSGLRTP